MQKTEVASQKEMDDLEAQGALVKELNEKIAREITRHQDEDTWFKLLRSLCIETLGKGQVKYYAAKTTRLN